VLNGLRYWQRPLLCYAGGDRAFLITIACEGGLPLQLLHREKAKLHRYFKAILEAKQNFHTLPTERLAEQCKHHLPQSLHREMVYALSAQLIDAIRELQERIGDMKNPIVVLDQREPAWRKSIPLELEDDVARALLDNLVKDAAEIRRGAPARLGLQRTLRKNQQGQWMIQADIKLPGRFDAQELQQLFGIETGQRCELYLLPPKQDRVLLALLSHLNSGEYLVEPKKPQPFYDVSAQGEFKLILGQNRQFSEPVVVRGGEALGDLPWVFIDRAGDESNLEWIGSGVARTRYATAWVASLPGCQVVPQDNSAAEAMGEIAGTGRKLHKIHGSVRFVDAEGEYCTVKTEQNSEAAEHFYLQGKTVPYGENAAPVFLGLPVLQDANTFQAIPADKLEWRSIAGGRTWQTLTEPCVGKGIVRYTKNGELLFRASISILPHNFSVRGEQGSRPGSATLHFAGIEHAELVSHDISGVSIHQAGHRLEYLSENQPPAYLLVSVCWPIGATLPLHIPFPAPNGCFVSGEGKVLAHGDLVPVEKLTGCKALVLNPKHGRRFRLMATLKTTNPTAGRNFWFETFLQPSITPDCYELNLRDLKTPLQMLLSAISDLDNKVELCIETRSNAILVAWYDLQIDPDKPADKAQVNEKDARRLDVDTLQRLVAEIRPLWQPDAEPDILSSTAPGVWALDSMSRTPGPWLVTVKDGNWQRGRPLLVPIGQASEKHKTQLQQTVCLPAPEQREQALSEVMQALSTNPNHPDWETLLNYFKYFGDLPPHSLDVFVALSKHPQAAVMALFKSDTETFEVVWSLLKLLPFSWLTIPLEIWSQAACCYADDVHDALHALPDTEMQERFFDDELRRFFNQLTEDRHPAANALSEWMRHDIYGYFYKKDKELQLAGQAIGRNILREHLANAQQELLRRQADHDDWPQANMIQEWTAQVPEIFRQFWLATPQYTEFRKPVLNAPVITALSCVLNISLEQPLWYEIRRLRLFDVQWFDEAYRLIFTLAAGLRIEQGQ